MNKRLTRSNNKIIGGVCGGIAEYLDTDPTVVRVCYSAATFLTSFCGILFYLVLWLIIPENKSL